MTVYVTKTYTYKIEDSMIAKARIKNQKMELKRELNKYYSKRPSKIFGKMFEQPSVWMGYSDQDTIEKNISSYAEFDSSKYSKLDLKQ